MLESQVGPLRAWMSKVLPSLDESEPVHGDVETVHELTTAHEVRSLGCNVKLVSVRSLIVPTYHML